MHLFYFLNLKSSTKIEIESPPPQMLLATISQYDLQLIYSFYCHFIYLESWLNHLVSLSFPQLD